MAAKTTERPGDIRTGVRMQTPIPKTTPKVPNGSAKTGTGPWREGRENTTKGKKQIKPQNKEKKGDKGGYTAPSAGREAKPPASLGPQAQKQQTHKKHVK
ncbi:Hypothetical predicted protein [Pelobates cultripes]|uniref:Uncharacterized protein n=1 Tax=Pelobates cultripes TaxID=61616 RepID=A0AAD1WBA0_PELCU|nr:Hypothetical predicted protein [Pelobates cultripes]